MSSDILEDFISIDDLAKELGMHLRTVERKVRLGHLPAPVRLGNTRYFSRQAVREKLLEIASESRALVR
ncbi:MAG: helix-turn-helix domain-containing protein [Alphaproteobacteria bacterium]